jgi:hypothetical protein
VDDLHTKVAAWFQTQGYPLEMRVARAFRDARFRVTQSEYYEDPGTSTRREVDVVASVQREIHKVLVRVSIVAECKVSRDKPWVLFTAPNRLAAPASVAQRTSSRFGRLLLKELSHDPSVQALPLLALPDRTAYGVTQALTSGKDVTYEACVSVAGASVAQAVEADRHSDRGRAAAEIIFPTVVVDGRMFEAYLDDAGDVVIAEAESGVLVWRNPLGNVVHTVIHVITSQAIAAFVQQAYDTAQGVLAREDSVARIGAKGPA